MKVEARRNRVRLTLESNDTEAHATLTDFKPFVEAALQRAAVWFDQEVERIRREGVTAPPTLGHVFYDAGLGDPLAEFRPETER